MTWQELIETVLSNTRLYWRALAALTVAAGIALLVFLLVLTVK